MYIIHEVVATKAKHDMYRLFNGWRLTLSDKPLFDTNLIMKNQSITQLGGGMFPPMYSANHGSCYLGIPTFKEETTKTSKKWAENIANKLNIK